MILSPEANVVFPTRAYNVRNCVGHLLMAKTVLAPSWLAGLISSDHW